MRPERRSECSGGKGSNKRDEKGTSGSECGDSGRNVWGLGKEAGNGENRIEVGSRKTRGGKCGGEER